MLKYRITNEARDYSGKTLYRIQAVREFEYNTTHEHKEVIKEGQLGGWVEKESNLSQDGNCWISDNAMVYGSAMVKDDASVQGNSVIYENAIICEEAIVFDRADILGNANIGGRAEISGNAVVSGNVKVRDKAIITDTAFVNGLNSIIDGNARIYNDAIVVGSVRFNGVVCGKGYVDASAVVYGKVCGDANVGGVTVVADSVIKGNAEIKDYNDYEYLVNQGVSVYRDKDGNIMVCWNHRLSDIDFFEAVTNLKIKDLINIK